MCEGGFCWAHAGPSSERNTAPPYDLSRLLEYRDFDPTHLGEYRARLRHYQCLENQHERNTNRPLITETPTDEMEIDHPYSGHDLSRNGDMRTTSYLDMEGNAYSEPSEDRRGRSRHRDDCFRDDTRDGGTWYPERDGNAYTPTPRTSRFHEEMDDIVPIELSHLSEKARGKLPMCAPPAILRPILRNSGLHNIMDMQDRQKKEVKFAPLPESPLTDEQRNTCREVQEWYKELELAQQSRWRMVQRWWADVSFADYLRGRKRSREEEEDDDEDQQRLYTAEI